MDQQLVKPYSVILFGGGGNEVMWLNLKNMSIKRRWKTNDVWFQLQEIAEKDKLIVPKSGSLVA